MLCHQVVTGLAIPAHPLVQANLAGLVSLGLVDADLDQVLLNLRGQLVEQQLLAEHHLYDLALDVALADIPLDADDADTLFAEDEHDVAGDDEMLEGFVQLRPCGHTVQRLHCIALALGQCLSQRTCIHS